MAAEAWSRAQRRARRSDLYRRRSTKYRPPAVLSGGSGARCTRSGRESPYRAGVYSRRGRVPLAVVFFMLRPSYLWY